MGTVTITITDEGPGTDRVSIAVVFDDGNGNGNGMSTLYASHVVALMMLGEARATGEVAAEQCFGDEEGGEHGPH